MTVPDQIVLEQTLERVVELRNGLHQTLIWANALHDALVTSLVENRNRDNSRDREISNSSNDFQPPLRSDLTQKVISLTDGVILLRERAKKLASTSKQPTPHDS